MRKTYTTEINISYLIIEEIRLLKLIDNVFFYLEDNNYFIKNECLFNT